MDRYIKRATKFVNEEDWLPLTNPDRIALRDCLAAVLQEAADAAVDAERARSRVALEKWKDELYGYVAKSVPLTPDWRGPCRATIYGRTAEFSTSAAASAWLEEEFELHHNDIANDLTSRQSVEAQG